MLDRLQHPDARTGLGGQDAGEIYRCTLTIQSSVAQQLPGFFSLPRLPDGIRCLCQIVQPVEPRRFQRAMPKHCSRNLPAELPDDPGRRVVAKLMRMKVSRPRLLAGSPDGLLVGADVVGHGARPALGLGIASIDLARLGGRMKAGWPRPAPN